MSKADSDSFSARQEQVILLASKGLADKQIAIELGLSIATIHTYWSRLRKKFGGGNRAELVTLALQRNAEETLTARESENLQLIAEIVRRAQAEKELAESQSKLQAIIDNTPVAVFVKDRYGRYTLVNSVFQELVGRDREIIIGSRDHDLFGGELGAKYQEQDQAVLESREPVEGEITFHGPNGDRHFLCIKFPLIDTEDNVYAVGGFANDITSRTEVARQLRASERRYRTVIENSTDAITLVDKSGNILYASPSVKNVMGLEPKELIGTNAFRYIDREDLSRIVQDFKGLVAKPDRSIEASYWITDTKGSRRCVEGRGRSLIGDSGSVEVLLNFRDVTGRKLSERRLAAKSAVARALAEADGLEAAFQVILRNLCESLICQYGAVWLVSAEKQVLTCEAQYFVPTPGMDLFAKASREMTFAPGEQFPGRVWANREPQWETNFQTTHYKRARSTAKARLKTAFAFPIIGEDAVLGVVEIFSLRSTPGDKEFLDGLGVIGYQIGQFMKRKMAEAEELRLAKELASVHADLKAVNEALERRVRTRTIELEETNARLQQEIAERKRSEEDLLNMFHFAQGVIESSPEGIVCFDRDCNITAWNKSMEEMSGLPRLEVLGHNAFSIFPFLVEVGEDEQFRRTLEGETLESEGKPYKVIGDGSIELYNASYRPVRNDANEVIGGIVIVREHEPANRVTCL